MSLQCSVNPSDAVAGKSRITEICVFIPVARWSVGRWIGSTILLVLAGLILAGIMYAAWFGIRARRWDLAIVPLALLPWWWLFGAPAYWLLKSIRRGGYPLVLLVGEVGMAMGVNDEGTLVRAFDNPSLRETDDELIIKNGVDYMVARLPKNQLSSEHVDLIRRCVRNTRARDAN